MTGRSPGGSDLRKLFAFVVGVTVVLAVVPAAFGLAGIDVRDASLGIDVDGLGANTGDELDDGSLLVLSSFGHEVNDDRTTVGVVELLVTPAGDAVGVDDVTVTWDGTDSYELTPTHVRAGDASFGVETLDNGTELQPSERAVLRFDLGSDDIGEGQRFGDRLTPGETVTVTITTGDGTETTETLTVPDPLPPGVAVRFV